MKLLTVCYGGCWDSNCKYNGEVFSKAVVIEESINLNELTSMIAQRCNINASENSIKFSHLNPFVDVTNSYMIENEEDLLSFMRINDNPGVNWKMPLYVILKPHTIDDNYGKSLALATIPQSVDVVCVGSSGGTSIERTNLGIIDQVEASQNVIMCSNTDFLEVGKLYSSKDELKSVVEELSYTLRFGYRVDKSTKNIYKVRCVDVECPWKILGTLVCDTGYFEIRKYIQQHTCSFNVRISQQRTPSYKSIARKLKTRFEGVKRGPDALQIQNDMQKECNQRISYWKARKEKEEANNLLRGTPEENYAMLPQYCHVLKQNNEGTYTNFKMDSNNNFKYVFIALGASIKGFQFLRKVISVDGTFLHGKYGGNLMTVVGQDVNQQIFPIAYAVVDSENDDSWRWIFQNLMIVIPPTPDIVVIFDRHVIIKNAVSAVYGPAKHVYCTRHIKQNLRTKFHSSSGLINLYVKASESYTQLDFHRFFQDILKVNPEMRRYPMDAGVDKWSRAYFDGDRYNMMTTNNSEYINVFLKIARSYQLVSLFEFIREMVTRWLLERRDKALKQIKDPPEKIKSILMKNIELSSRYDVKPLNQTQFAVSGGDFSGVVDQDRKICSCRVFDLEKYPCTHVMAVIQTMKCDSMEFICPYYSSHAWIKTYEETIYPLPPKGDWIVPDDIRNIMCLPPQVKRKCGRPKRNRFPLEGEFKSLIKTKKKRKNYKCSLCGCDGHNKKRCTNQGQSSGRNDDKIYLIKG